MLSRRDFCKIAGTTAVLCASGCSSPIHMSSKNKRPNIIFILADDLGAKDLGCYGSTFYETPNIDRLAREGIKFTDAYAASPVCAPTRAAIQSGKHPARLGINFILDDGLVHESYKLHPPRCETEMKLSEVTFAEELRNNGYKTFFAGKWHLGKKEKYYPQHQGYDINIAGHSAGQPASYFYPYKSDYHNGYFNVPGLEGGHEGEYLTDRLTDETLRFIDEHQNIPFLAFLSLYSPHTPLEAKPERVEKYKTKAKDMSIYGNQDYEIEPNACYDWRTGQFDSGARTKLVQNNAIYAAMIESIDQNVGRIARFLEHKGIAENTVVIFYSDNGGFSTHTHLPLEKIPTANAPLRAGKAWLYEGGIRVPLIIKWPDITKQGSVCDVPVTSVDFYPTIMQIAGISEIKQQLDGLSLVPLLEGNSQLGREAIFWHMPHYHSSGVLPSGAVRSGDYKLIEYFEDSKLELFDLSNDPSERDDLSTRYPDVVGRLKKLLYSWRDDVDAAMPTKKT